MSLKSSSVIHVSQCCSSVLVAQSRSSNWPNVYSSTTSVLFVLSKMLGVIHGCQECARHPSTRETPRYKSMHATDLEHEPPAPSIAVLTHQLLRARHHPGSRRPLTGSHPG